MNKALKISVIIILIGIILSTIGFLTGGSKTTIILTKDGIKAYDSSKNKSIVEKSFDLEKFNKVNIETPYLSYIEIVKGEKYKLDVKYSESDKINYSIKDGILSIGQTSIEDKGISIGFHFNFNENLEQKIKLYVPEDCSLEELKISSSSSNIKIIGLAGKSIDINNDYGDMSLSDISCENMIIKADSGNMELANVKAGEISFDNDYGDMDLKNINSENFICTMSSGFFKGEGLNISNNYKIESDYGNVDIKNSSFGSFEGILNSGDFQGENLNVSKDYNLENDYGSVNVKNSSFGSVKANLSDGNFEGENLKISENYNIDSEYGDVSIKSSSLGNLTAVLSSGNIQLEDITSIKNVDIKCEYGEAELSGNLNREGYNYYLKTDYGIIKFNGKEYENNYNQDNKAEHNVNITAEDGSISLEF